MQKVLNMVKSHSVLFGIFSICTILDFVTKLLVEKFIRYGQRIDIIGSFVQFTRMYNDGGVFGIFQGHKNFFLLISFIVLAIMIAFYIYEKNKTFIFKCSMGLIFSGAVGNILDRVAGKPGVVDFVYIGIDPYRWPAFNVADAVIVIGALLLFFTIFKSQKKKEEKSQ
jgi:signal peptidase II